LCLDGLARSTDFLLLRSQQIEQTYLHGVVLKLRFLDDAVTQRQHLSSGIVDNLTRVQHPIPRRANVRANLHGKTEITLLKLTQFCFATRLDPLSEIKKWNLNSYARSRRVLHWFF